MNPPFSDLFPPQMMFLWQRTAVWVLQERKSNAVSRLRTPWKNGVRHHGLFPRTQLSTRTSTSTPVVAAVRPISLKEQGASVPPKSTSQSPAWLSFWLEEEPQRPRPRSRMEWPASEDAWFKVFFVCFLKEQINFSLLCLPSLSFVENRDYLLPH